MDYSAHGSKYFDIREFVHPRTWEESKQSPARCNWLIDPKVVRICDLVREISGVPVYVNNWLFYKPGRGMKKYVSSGFRASWDSTGASYSQHRTGRAADVKPRGFTGRQTFELVMDNKERFLKAGLTTIENPDVTPSWLHLDVRPRLVGVADILIVNP